MLFNIPSEDVETNFSLSMRKVCSIVYLTSLPHLYKITFLKAHRMCTLYKTLKCKSCFINNTYLFKGFVSVVLFPHPLVPHHHHLHLCFLFPHYCFISAL